MTDESIDDDSAEVDTSGWLRVLDRRTPVTTGWRSGDVVRRTVVRRKRRQVLFGGSGTAIVAAIAITSGVMAGTTPQQLPDQVVAVRGVHIARRVDGAVQLVADSHSAGVVPSSLARSSLAHSVTPVVQAQQELAIKLLQQLGNRRHNVSVSPSSLQLALAMLQNGARGTTETQIATALQSSGISTQQQNAELAELTSAESAASRGHLQLDSANSLWQQEGYRVRREFLASIAPFDAGVWQTDFRTQQGLDAINRWTGLHTHGKISKLFDHLDPSTVLVLANALYLHANWASPFETGETTTGPFTTADGRRVSAHFMSGAEGLRSASTGDYEALQIPYRGGRFAALAVMPTHGSLSTFVAGLVPQRIAAVATSLNNTTTQIEFPRFTTRTTSNLIPTLRALGMRQAFTPSANLSGIGSGALQVDQVVQRVYLRVDTKGTTAAAATGIVAVAGSTGSSLRFDHPFLFLVRDTVTGAILFASEINDPTAG